MLVCLPNDTCSRGRPWHEVAGSDEDRGRTNVSAKELFDCAMPSIGAFQSSRGNPKPGQASGPAEHRASAQEVLEGGFADRVRVRLSAACLGWISGGGEGTLLWGVFSSLSNLIEEETTTRDSGGWLCRSPPSQSRATVKFVHLTMARGTGEFWRN